MTLYGADLALVHADGFGEVATSAVRAVLPLLREKGRVYDLGCGSGITTRVLTDAGFDVVAVDASAALLAHARAAAPAAAFVHTSLYDVELLPCVAVLAVGEVLGYHAPDVDADALVRAFFARAAKALAIGGKLVFDVIVDGEPSLDGRGWKSGGAWMVASETREHRATGRLTREIETFVREDDGRYRRTREVHHVRVWRERELRAWLEEAGFAVETKPGSLPRRSELFGTRH